MNKWGIGKIIMYKNIVIVILFAVLIGGYYYVFVYYEGVMFQRDVLTDNPPSATTTIPVVIDEGEQTERIAPNDEYLLVNHELRDVNFCGKIFKVKQIIINEVDVVQRIAEIVTKDLVPNEVDPYDNIAKGICEKVHNNSHNILKIYTVEAAIRTNETTGQQTKGY